MMKLSKKGEGLIFAGFIIFLLGFSILFFIPDSIVQEKPIGVKQYDILYKNEEAQAAQLYLKLAAKKSSEAALINLFETVGLYRLTDDKGGFAKTICGDHIYPLYTSPKGDCVPTFSTSLKSYFQDALARYNEGYDAFPLTYVYNIDFEQNIILNIFMYWGKSILKVIGLSVLVLIIFYIANNAPSYFRYCDIIN